VGSHITFAYWPDGERIKIADLHEVYRLSQVSGPIFGWLNTLDVSSGRFTRRLSHRVIEVREGKSELLVEVEPAATAAGKRLRRLFDEQQPLAISPYLRGETSVRGQWVWAAAELIAWDAHLLPDRDSPLDRIVRALHRGGLSD
jgi:hypothetical protein